MSSTNSSEPTFTQETNTNSTLTEPLMTVGTNTVTSEPTTVASKKGRRVKLSQKQKKERRLQGRIKKLSHSKHPLDKTGIFGAMFFTWVNPFLWIGNRSSYQQDYHPSIPKRDSVINNEKKILNLYAKKGSLGKSIISLYLGSFVKSFFLMGFCQLFITSLAILMLLLLNDVADEDLKGDDAIYRYIYWLCAIVGSQIFGAFLQNYITCDLSRLSVRLKNAVIYAIYKKVMKISVLNPTEHTEGNILNYIQVDAQKLEDAITRFSLVLESIWQIIFGFSICIFLVSYNVVSTVICFFSLTFLTICLYKYIFKFEVQFMVAKDKRTELLKNVLSNVKFIKSRVWENFYHTKIFIRRKLELRAMNRSNWVFVIVVFMNWINPTVSYLITFASMLYFDFAFETAKILAFIKIFSTILKGMGNIPNCIQFFIELKVSMKRLNLFMDTMEIDRSYVNQKEDGDSVFSVELDCGNFYWNRMNEDIMKQRRARSRKRKVKIRKFNKNNFHDETALAMNQSVRTVSVLKSTVSKGSIVSNVNSRNPVLTASLISQNASEKVGFQLMDIDLLIPKGELTMIFGQIGAGKSSIFYSLMGEMNPKYADPKPKLNIEGEVYFVSQKPWLLNMSVRANIILDKPFSQQMFDRAVRLAALDSDLKMFDDGADRIVSDGAANLSGGQKTRVALARAIYQDPDIYLFDDPLSALDGNVGGFLMENTITKDLKDKTRVIITHALHFLKFADKCIYIDDGDIVFKGTYEQLKKEAFFEQFMKEKQIEEEEKKEKEKKEGKKPKDKIVDEVRKLDPGLVKENPLLRMFTSEDRNKGRVSLKILNTFIKNTGGYIAFFLVIANCIVGAYFQIFAVKYLLAWSDDFKEDQKWVKMVTFSCILIGYCCLATFRFAALLALGTLLSKKMHANMVFRILHAPVEEFLEIVPLGRILNRFTKDINMIDKILMKIWTLFVFKFIFLFAQFYFMIQSIDIIICIPLLVFFVTSFIIQNRSMNTKREIVRLEAISKSPIVTWASQTIRGLPQIRSSKKSNFFISKMVNLIEGNLKNSILIYGLDGWFQLRISLCNVFIVQIPSFAWIIYNYGDSPPIVELAIFLLLSSVLTDDILKMLTSLSEVESGLISIERCQFFNDIPPETQYQTVKEEQKKYLLPSKKIHPADLCLPFSNSIVTNGHVKFEDVTARYGEDAEPVLKNLTFEVKPGEKVGIVGRTGAGKSSLIKLFWLSLKPSSGRILVDGTDITKVDLKKIRNEVMLVSQEAALFLGTLRENIDPTVGKANDEEMKRVLNLLGFKNKLYLDKGLEATVEADGSNFSQGERQVICFARTLVNKRKLIILDEATANIDVKTEMAIQEAQDTEFTKSTMFIIAHRINTVLKCDKIMVLKFGEIMEFDSPTNLLKNEDSYFKEIYDKMVEQNEEM